MIMKKKATKKSFEKALKEYINNLNKEDQYTVAMGIWHVWNASHLYHKERYGGVKLHSDIRDIALIAAEVYNEKE